MPITAIEASLIYASNKTYFKELSNLCVISKKHSTTDPFVNDLDSLDKYFCLFTSDKSNTTYIFLTRCKKLSKQIKNRIKLCYLQNQMQLESIVICSNYI